MFLPRLATPLPLLFRVLVIILILILVALGLIIILILILVNCMALVGSFNLAQLLNFVDYRLHSKLPQFRHLMMGMIV